MSPSPAEQDREYKRRTYEEEMARRRKAHEEERAKRKALYELSKSPEYRSFKTPEEEAQARYLVQQLFQPSPAPAVNAPAAPAPAPVPAPQGGMGDPSALLLGMLQTMNTIVQRLQQIQTALQELKTLVQDRPVVGP